MDGWYRLLCLHSQLKIREESRGSTTYSSVISVRNLVSAGRGLRVPFVDAGVWIRWLAYTAPFQVFLRAARVGV